MSDCCETEFDGSVFWRSNLDSQKRRVWNPRLLLFDLKNNWTSRVVAGTHQSNSISSASNQEINASWDGKVHKFFSSDSESQKQPNPQDPYSFSIVEATADQSNKTKIDNEKSVAPTDTKSEINKDSSACWSEYARWRLNPAFEAGFSIPNFQHNVESGVLCSYEQGQEIFRTTEDSVIESLRRYSEETDCLEVNCIYIYLMFTTSY